MRHNRRFATSYSARWDELSYEGQRDYLEQHPSSKKKITKQPEANSKPLEQIPDLELDGAITETQERLDNLADVEPQPRATLKQISQQIYRKGLHSLKPEQKKQAYQAIGFTLFAAAGVMLAFPLAIPVAFHILYIWQEDFERMFTASAEHYRDDLDLENDRQNQRRQIELLPEEIDHLAEREPILFNGQMDADGNYLPEGQVRASVNNLADSTYHDLETLVLHSYLKAVSHARGKL